MFIGDQPIRAIPDKCGEHDGCMVNYIHLEDISILEHLPISDQKIIQIEQEIRQDE